MFKDFTRLYLIADQFHPDLIRPLYIDLFQGPLSPETIYGRMKLTNNTVHGTGSIEEDILLYALLKAAGLKLVDNINKCKHCWPVVTTEDLVSATANWQWRKQIIGDRLPELLQVMKEKDHLRLCQDGDTLFFGLTPQSVCLILKTAGYSISPEMVSY